MTAIVGVVNKKDVWIGGDSAGVDEHLGLMARKDPKVFQRGPYLIGFTQSFRMGQILHFNMKPPRATKKDAYQHMVQNFIPEVRKCLTEQGHMKYDAAQEYAGGFLTGYKGRLFYIDTDLQVAETFCGYDACGCGAKLSLGSLFTTKSLKMAPEDRIRLALEAAEEHSAGVCGPYLIKKLK